MLAGFRHRRGINVRHLGLIHARLGRYADALSTWQKASDLLVELRGEIGEPAAMADLAATLAEIDCDVPEAPPCERRAPRNPRPST